MKNYKIGVLGLSETRWLQTGQLRFSSGEQLLYSGHTEDGAPHTEGVALMLAPEAQRALIGWEPVNSRIITAKFITKKKDIKLNIIQCYAPTNDAEEEKKDDFYQQLQTVIDRGGAKDMTILMGDFNAKIGSDNTGYEDTMGTHGLGQMNENGERFADFCALSQLVMGGSIFPHKRIHKATWRSPDHVTENQIDHICISRKFRRSWRDVRVMRGKVLNGILLERMREAVDPTLRDQQAGFRRNRSCADQIASLRIIVEQSLEWNSPLYINFIDYEKAFDSVDREALWKLLRHYGVPGKIISLIQCTYQDMSCRIAHAGQLSESFEVKTGVRQGCLLSPFLFLLVIDWIMKTTTAGRKNGIQWTLWTQLDDLDFADDLALLSHSHSQMQDKTTCLEATSAGAGLKINRKKTELMRINATANTPVTVGGEPIREVESFVYLGSVVDGQGGTGRDVTAGVGKAGAAMVMLKNVWASKVVSIRTKLRIFGSNVGSVLLCGCEAWRTAGTVRQRIQTFLNACLGRIFGIRWPEGVRGGGLWGRAGRGPVAKQILRRKWGWIGHTLRKPASSTTRQALTWNPQGKRKRGRPRNGWRRDTEAELCADVMHTWQRLETAAGSEIRRAAS
nr:hypothetical protein BaRGS_002115 [Batillaria attramentaria]